MEARRRPRPAAERARDDLRPGPLGLSVGYWKTALANFTFFIAYYLVMPSFPLASLRVGGTPGQMGHVLAGAGVLQVALTLLVVGPAINRGPRRPHLLARRPRRRQPQDFPRCARNPLAACLRTGRRATLWAPARRGCGPSATR
jgi:hypothetical protein